MTRILRAIAARLYAAADRLDGRHSGYLSGATIEGSLSLHGDTSRLVVTDCHFLSAR